MTQKFKCATCGGQLVLVMPLHGGAKPEEFVITIKEAQEAQKNGSYEFRHLTGGCKKLIPLRYKEV